MKKCFILLAVLLTLSAVVVSPVLAQEVAFSGYGEAGHAVITPPYHSKFKAQALDFEHSTFGPHDVLIIYVWVDSPEFTGFSPWVVITDNAESAMLWETVFASITYLRVVLVDEEDLDVWSLFRRVTAILRVPIEGETPNSTLVIHPFTMNLRGQDCGEWTKVTIPLQAGRTMNIIEKVYKATATVTGPDECEWPAEEAIVGNHLKLAIKPIATGIIVCPTDSSPYVWTSIGSRSENFIWICLEKGHKWIKTYPDKTYQRWRQAPLTPEYVRDYTILYLCTIEGKNLPDPLKVEWTGGRETPDGLIGSETYVYKGEGLVVTIKYPVVLPKDTKYTISVQSQGTTVWEGELFQRQFTST